MRFLFVGSYQTDLFKIGGIESSIKELAFFLLNNGHHVTIFQIDKEKKGRVYLENKFGKLEIYYGNKFAVRNRILVSKFDVINFIQTPFENVLFILLFLIKKTLTKTITSKFFFTYPPFKKYNFFQAFKYRLLIDKCFTFSERLTKEVRNKTNNVCFLFPPVSNYFFKKKRPKKSNDKIRIMYAGRLCRDKGLDLIIDIYKNLDRNKYLLYIYGYFISKEDKLFYMTKINSLNLDYLNIIERKIKSSIFVHPSLYNCDILLLPYQDLTPTLDIPLLILEGMVSGCKVITSCIGDIPFLKGNVCCIKNYNTPQKFISMIRKIANEDLKRYNYDEFSIKSIGKKYLKFLMQK